MSDPPVTQYSLSTPSKLSDLFFSRPALLEGFLLPEYFCIVFAHPYKSHPQSMANDQYPVLHCARLRARARFRKNL